MCMWSFRAREGPEDTRAIIEPELICKGSVDAGVTDLCFLDEWNLVASLENGSVVLLRYSSSTKVSAQLLLHRASTIAYPLPNTVFGSMIVLLMCLLTSYRLNEIF